MRRFLLKLLSPLVLSVLGLLALSVLVWFLGPLLAIGDSHPLEPMWMRILIVALLWSILAARLAWVAWQRRRTNAALLQGLAAGPSASDKEAQVLAARFNEAVGKLKASRGGSGLAALGGGGQYLYELPWYVFVGAPGSGKTTALKNAGLQFLLSDGAGGQASVQGVGGTRNCEWWFTKDAVLIDTAGRYATQESDRDVDASAWDNFLALLKKTRPRQPINGVLLTVNVQDLLQQGTAERQEHAAKLRARLAELQAKLGVKAPVYVLVTKADLIGGFNETFEALGKDERDQVWGYTFRADVAAGADPLAEMPVLTQQLQKRLAEQLVDRLEAERDVIRRSAMFGFPQEFAALQPVLSDFLRLVFSGGGTLEAAPRVRGVYFTSGTQEGSPIDRVMGALGRSFGIDSRSAAIAPGRGKSFFLHRLLKEVVFAERGLGALNPVAERRRRVLRTAAMAAMAVFGIGLAIGWVLSRYNNLDHAAQVAARLPEVRQAVAGLPPPSSADVSPLALPLAQLRDAAQIDDFDLDDPPLLHGLGLYQGDKLDAGARIAYHRLLDKTLVPRVARRLEEQLRAAGKDRPEYAYEALKAYVMLYQREHFDAGSLKAWVGADWDANYPNLAPAVRQQLDAHLDAMLARGAPQSGVPFDEALVATAREILIGFPLEYRVFSRIQSEYKAGSVPDFTVAGAGGPNAAQVFVRASGEPLTRGVPGLYTRDGYRNLVVPAIESTTPVLAAEEPWVMGLKAEASRPQRADDELTDKVKRLVLAKYIETWDKYLDDVQLAPLKDPERALSVARLLSAVDSPLTGYLRGVAAETTLVPPAAVPGALDNIAGQVARKATGAAGRATGVRLPVGGVRGGADARGPVEALVDEHYTNIHRLFEGEPPPVAETQRLFGEIFAQLAAVDAAKKSKSPPPPGGGAERVKIAAAQQPPVVRGMLEQLADATLGQSRSAELGGLSTELKPITDICNRAITGRYPFAAGSRADVLPEDFGQVFGVGGLLDDFFQRRLASLVDTSTRTWTYRPLTDGTRPVSPASLADFQRAQRIREVFFRSGGKAPSMRVELRLTELEPSLKELQLDIDGQVQKLTTGGPSITVAWPSTRMASVLRLTTGLGSAGPMVITEGPWALFRMFDRFQVEPSSVPERFVVVMSLDGKRARMEVIAASVFNPFQLREVKQFRCPAAL